MSRYHVVIMGREAPELLTREGYASKGEARRAWATAARGAVLLEDGMVIDEKTGTTKTTAAALRRFAAKLKLDVDEPVIDEEPEEEQAPEADDEESEEAAPPPLPARASKVRAGHCPSCDAVLPDHLSTCPTLPAAMPAKGFEFDDQPDKGFFEASTSFEVTHAIAPNGAVHQGDDTERLARPAVCVAKGCDASTGEVRTTTPSEFTCLCPGHRQAARFVVRDHDRDRAGAVEWLRANVRKAHIRAERVQKPPPRVAASKTKPAEAKPLTLDELVDAAATVLDATPSEVGLFIGRSVVEVLVDDKSKVSVRRDRGADPVKLLAAALVERSGDLVEIRRGVVDSAERALTTARTRHADAVALTERLRAAGGA